MFINTIVATGSEMLSYVTVALVYDKVGMKITYVVAHCIAALGCTLYVIFGESYP
jgi:uncharacterized membrane protein YGL010W